jgi:hypothetical protein
MSTDWRTKVDEFRLRQQEQRERHPLGWLLNGCAAVAELAALFIVAVLAVLAVLALLFIAAGVVQ